MPATATKSGLTALIETAENLGESLTVDRDAGIIRGVKIIGLQSKNGRRYLQEAVNRAIPKLYEGKVVNIDHPLKEGSSRSSYDRFGVFRNVREATTGGAIGDLHYLKSHNLAESVCEDAERKLGAFGMSQNAKGRTAVRGGETIVEEIVSVSSVDLVADPATTKNLYEQIEGAESVDLQELLDAANARIAELTKTIAELETEKATVKEEVDGFKATQKKADHKAAIVKLLDEAKIPATARGNATMSLLESSTIEAAAAFIKESLVPLAGKAKSVSGSAHLKESKTDADAHQVTDGKSFAASIR